MRLFIACNFSSDIKRSIADSVELLRQQAQDGSFSLTDNYHLTLAFLGEEEPSRVRLIKEAMAACPFTPLPVTIGRFGSFRRGEGGDIAWRKLNAPQELWVLQSQLLRELKARGFRPDDKKFSPHLTVARQLVLKPGASFAAINASAEPIECLLTRMDLMKSERIRGRLTYTAI